MPGGIDDDDDFWNLLRDREIIQEPIFDRYGRGCRPIGGFSGPYRFASPFEGLIQNRKEWLIDPGLFGLSEGEFVVLDPQTRMLLTCSWEVIERSGWSLNALHNSPTGVFVGAQVPSSSGGRRLNGSSPFDPTSGSLAMLANRISYHFNLMGPSVTYCTACSASLTALHTAIGAIRAGDCRQALVGTSTYLGRANFSAAFNALGVISPEGKCHTFDAEANGYMRSEGTFVFAIKPLQDAERDGDRIWAVVEATGVNAAGAADDSVGLSQGRYITAPTRHAQEKLIKQTCERAGRKMPEIDYLEAHSTGTVIGDSTEGNALAKVFGNTGRSTPLRIASVKSNVGHMEAAAFLCSLLKIVLMMQRRMFAPVSRNFLVPNPDIDFTGNVLQVQTICEPFPEHPVVIGINSFGFGGANGHCIVREYRSSKPTVWSVPPAPKAGYMIPLSARTPVALVQSAKQLGDVLKQQDIDLYTLAGNLACRRTHFPARTAFAVLEQNDLLAALDDFVAEEPVSTPPVSEDNKRLAMVFSGQGTQWAHCGRELYQTEPVFRRAIDAIEDLWLEHAGYSLRHACFFASPEEINEVRLAQPIIFMIQCALVELLKTWNIYPDCVAGHSSGEVSAAYACGALSLKDATRLVYHRATLQQRTAGSGRMLVIGLDIDGVKALLDEWATTTENSTPERIEIACHNGPASTVVCGTESPLSSIAKELDRRQLQNRLLPGNIAFHSTAMERIKEDVLTSLAFLDEYTFRTDVPFISSVSGKTTTQLDSDYWWSNIRQPVRFAEAMTIMLRAHSPDIVLEIAPHCALQPTIAQCLEENASKAVCIPTLMHGHDTRLGFQRTLGALFRHGAILDFKSQYPKPQPITHRLPGHPKQEKADIDIMTDGEMFMRQGTYAHGPLVGRKIPSDHLLFESFLSAEAFPWLADHRVYHAAIMPAAGYVELILEAFEGAPLYFESIHFLHPLPISKTPTRLLTALWPTSADGDEFSFTVKSSAIEVDASSELHCRGRVRLGDNAHKMNVPLHVSGIKENCFEVSTVAVGNEFYERLEAILGDAFQYGPYFRTIKRAKKHVTEESFLFEVEMDENLWHTGRDEGYILCPPLFDGGLQTFLYRHLIAADHFTIPQRIEALTFLRPPSGARLICHVVSPSDKPQIDRGQLTHGGSPEYDRGSINFYDPQTGDLVAHFDAYICFVSNPRWEDLTKSKHMIVWQPKFIDDSQAIANRLPEGDITPASLIYTLEAPHEHTRHVCRVVELAGRQEPESTLLHNCIETLEKRHSQAEYWLVGTSEEATEAYYTAFHTRTIALRFVSMEASDTNEMDTGLLRPSAAEIVLLDANSEQLSQARWERIKHLLVPGGFALVRHSENAAIVPTEGWRTIRPGRIMTLVQLLYTSTDKNRLPQLPAPRWILGETGSWAADWVSHIDHPGQAKLISDEASEDGDWHELVNLRAIDFFSGTDAGDPTGEKLTARFIAFVQAIVATRTEQENYWCRLTVITRRAAHDVEDPRGSVLWGAVRSMAMEIGEEAKIDFRLVDLGDVNDLKTLAGLACCDLRERELAIRRQRLWVPRITSIHNRHASVPPDEECTYRLRLENTGQISGLCMTTFEMSPLGPEDIDVDVKAAALNFRDIMVTLSLLPLLAYERSAFGHEVGMESSGIVRRVGSAIQNFRIGDEVIVVSGGCIANRMVADQRKVFAKPGTLSLEQAASVLSVTVTAYYALVQLVGLRKGQSVLIHSAMGGVGQAAISLARHIGAEIYATAGSEDKRNRLQAMGVRAAFDSHSYDWYDALQATTGGEGVDVVLNSLTGRHIELSLRALRPGGWHCEIGKVDIYSDSSLGLLIFRKNLRFAAIDIDRLMVDDPDLMRTISSTCLDLLEQGALSPLPITVFPYADYDKAMRLMTKGQHQGKLVLKAPDPADTTGFLIADRQPIFDPEATYLVTGGFGGFGLRLLSYLVSAGAHHITMMDRDPERKRDTAWLCRESLLRYTPEKTVFDIVSGDVAVAEDVRRCIAQTKRSLKGVFHLAGTLDDRLLDDLTTNSVKQVFAPKAHGALNLHRATADCPLDYFVLFSSTSSILGNPGQINYSAANSFLDGLAAHRQQQGLPGFSFCMSAICDAGMATRRLPVLRAMRASGVPPISSVFAIANLDYALRRLSNHNHLVSALFERPAWTIDVPDYMRVGRLIRNQDAFGFDVAGTLTVEDIVEIIGGKVAELCGHFDGRYEEPVSSFGLTSISVAELGAFIQTRFNHRVSALRLMTTASALSLAQEIVQGTDGIEEEAVENETIPVTEAINGNQHHGNRTASVFANHPEDHFPNGSAAI